MKFGPSCCGEAFGRLLVLMDNELSASAVPSIPPGFVAVPISVNQLGLPLRICVVARAAGADWWLWKMRWMPGFCSVA